MERNFATTAVTEIVKENVRGSDVRDVCSCASHFCVITMEKTFSIVGLVISELISCTFMLLVLNPG